MAMPAFAPGLSPLEVCCGILGGTCVDGAVDAGVGVADAADGAVVDDVKEEGREDEALEGGGRANRFRPQQSLWVRFVNVLPAQQ